MTKIKLAMRDQNDKDIFKEKDGIIYKGIGILEWLSAGKQKKFAIDLNTGLIIPSLCGDDIKEQIDKYLEELK